MIHSSSSPNGNIYTPAGYRNMVKMSKFKFILVEGKDDKTTFKYLTEELFGKRPDIIVKGAHEIRFGSNIENREDDIGNRERVEIIAESIKNKKYAKRFVGFVDREFRGFTLDNEIKDVIGKHNVTDRLIWSRGHSLENYYFDFSSLRRPLRHFSMTPHFDDALDLFEQNFEQIIRLACSVGLAGMKCGMLQYVKRSIDWTVLEFNTLDLTINTANWRRILNQKRIKSEDVNTIIETFQKLLEKLLITNFNVVRWICHGHIGITVIWAAYARCVFEVCQRLGNEDPRSEAINVIRANETVRCNGCASEWAQQALNKSCEYPAEIFNLLELT